MCSQAQNATAANGEDAVGEEDKSTKAGDDFLHTSTGLDQEPEVGRGKASNLDCDSDG